MGGRVVYAVAVSDLFEIGDFLDEASLHLREVASVAQVGTRDQDVFTELGREAHEILAVEVAHHELVER